MADSSQSVIRFVCPRCGAGLRTPSSFAGGTHRCPVCHCQMAVPAVDQPGRAADAESAGAQPEEPAAGPGEGGPPRRRPLRPGVTYIPVVCPRCETRMYAVEEEVGTELTCPDCGTRSVVARPKVQSDPIKPRPPIEIDEDEYRLCEGVDQPRPGSRAYARYITVICPVCSTRMLAAEDQVGSQIVCPDCTVPTTVPPPAPVVTHRPPVVVVGPDEYRVHDGVDQPPPGATYVPVVCGVCGTRLYAAEDQVGRQITCPDCQTRQVVPPPPPGAKIYDPMADADQTYGVGRPIQPPEIRVGVDYRQESHAGDELPSDRVRWHRAARQTPPPRWTFFSGVFTFPLYQSSLVCLIVLSLGAMVVALLAAFAVALSLVPSEATWIASMALSGLTAASCLLWIVVASAYLLAIVRDTANGLDEVENWPGAMFLDWLGDSYFVFSSLAISMLPGLAVRQLLQSADREGWLCVPLGVLLGFPVLLASMLETDSPLRPISLPVLGTLLSAWWAWALFYIESTAVLAVALTIFGTLDWLVGLWGLPVAVPLLVGALMIYSRLLGRVIWHASGTAANTPRVTAAGA